MVRTLDLANWAGRWIALDESDRVARDAETLENLMAILDTEGVEGVSIMCAPVPGEPVRYGLGGSLAPEKHTSQEPADLQAGPASRRHRPRTHVCPIFCPIYGTALINTQQHGSAQKP